ncbi:hypothetical protein F4802DRAFT_60773 [Xylaria palmicola]|nr:hypothetical protein F4802DRAFT_60773 [Xylaria palmicola]
MMSKLGVSADLPSSPWAARFPVKEVGIISGDVNHSVLAPYPRISDPIYYDLEPSFEGPVRNYVDQDLILFTEESQRRLLNGKTTWQAAALNRHLYFSPKSGFISGGHQPGDKALANFPFLRIPEIGSTLHNYGIRLWPSIMGRNEERDFVVYQREKIHVDETKWLSFFRKDRWFDWTRVTSPFKKVPGRVWSVDDPKIWDFTSTSIELANRMLMALIADRNEGVMSFEDRLPDQSVCSRLLDSNNDLGSNRPLGQSRRLFWPFALSRLSSNPEPLHGTEDCQEARASLPMGSHPEYT